MGRHLRGSGVDVMIRMSHSRKLKLTELRDISKVLELVNGDVRDTRKVFQKSKRN